MNHVGQDLAVDVLADWAADLSHDNIILLTFQKTLTHYRAIQAKVGDEAEVERFNEVLRVAKRTFS
jgi:hypothetical protein